MKSGTYGNTRFHHRSTLDGNEVIINIPADKIRAAFDENDRQIFYPEDLTEDEDQVISPDVALIKVEVEGSDLKAFVLEMLRSELISRMEQANPEQLTRFLMGVPDAPSAEAPAGGVNGALVMRLVGRYAEMQADLQDLIRHRQAGTLAERTALFQEIEDVRDRLIHLVGAPGDDANRCGFFRRSDEAQCVLDEHAPSVWHDFGTGPSEAAARND